MTHLLNLSSDELRQWLTDRGHPAYRGRQIEHWLYQGRVRQFEEMTDLPARLRSELADHFQIWTGRIAAHETADDGTEKLLVEWAGGGRVECVLLRDGTRRSICISTQVGCAMGCVFCASGLEGVDRNLTRGEILEQMLLLARQLPDEERLSHIVVMGMGEPLANLDQLLPALDRASSRDRSGDRRAADHDLDCRSAGGHASAGATGILAFNWPCRCTHPTTSCAIGWCR